MSPQLGGVKVYSQHPWRRGEVLLDVDCVWASNCHLGINLMGAAVPASVSDIYVAGTLRIALRPLLRDYPLVGGMSVAFIVRDILTFFSLAV